MCIIVYKPKNIAFPKKATLETCFDHNSDGAGYMYTYNNKVHIRKGFKDFDSFYKDLNKIRKQVGDKIPFVMHFRISTQGGKKMELTHPYPLCDNYKEMRKLQSECQIGIAHNGIIHLTSEYSYGYMRAKQPDYNDTMTFIRDYLSIIISDKNYYKKPRVLELIERLCESKLAILDADGHCELIGDFKQENGVYYSNSTYMETQIINAPKPNIWKNGSYKIWDDDYFRGSYDNTKTLWENFDKGNIELETHSADSNNYLYQLYDKFNGDLIAELVSAVKFEDDYETIEAIDLYGYVVDENY